MQQEQVRFRKTLSSEDHEILYIDELVETSKGLKERIYALKPSNSIPVDSDDWKALHEEKEITQENLQREINRANHIKIQAHPETKKIDYVYISHWDGNNQSAYINEDGTVNFWAQKPTPREIEMILTEGERQYLEIRGKFSMDQEKTITDGPAILAFMSRF